MTSQLSIKAWTMPVGVGRIVGLIRPSAHIAPRMPATPRPEQRQVHSQLSHVVSWFLLLEQERYQFLLQLYGLCPRELFWLAWARQIYLYETQHPPRAGTEDVNAV